MHRVVKTVLYILFIVICQNSLKAQESESFNHFILEFFALEEFQFERTKFPLEFVYYDSGADEDEIKTVYLTKEVWEPIKDSIFVQAEYSNRIYNNFEQKTNDTDERVFTYEGNETCFSLAFYFKRQNGKWYLVKKENLTP